MASSVVRLQRARAIESVMAPPSDVGQPTPPTAFQRATGEAVVLWIFKYAIVRRHFKALDGLDPKESIVPVYRLVLKPLQELITAGGRGVRRLRQLAELDLGQLLEAASTAGLAFLSSRLVAVVLRSRMTLILDLLCLNPGDDDVYSEFMRYFCSQAMEDLSAKAEVVDRELLAGAGLFRDEMWAALAMDTEGQAGLVASGRMTRDAEFHRKKMLLDAQAVINCFLQEGEGDVIEKILNGGLSITSGFPISESALQLVHHCQRLRLLHSQPAPEALQGASGCDVAAAAAVQLPCEAVIELVELARAGEFRQQQQADDDREMLPQPSKKRRSLYEPRAEASAFIRACSTPAMVHGGTRSAEKICRSSEVVDSDLPRFPSTPTADSATATRSRRLLHVGTQLSQQHESTQASAEQRQTCRSLPSREAGATVATPPRQPSEGIATVGRRFEGTASGCNLSSHGLLFALVRERPHNIGLLLAMLRRHRVSMDTNALARAIRRLPLHVPSLGGGKSSGNCQTKRAISVSIAARVLLSALGATVPLKLSGRTASHPSAAASQTASNGNSVVVTPTVVSVSSPSTVEPPARQEHQPTHSSALADGESPVSAAAASSARLGASVDRIALSAGTADATTAGGTSAIAMPIPGAAPAPSLDSCATAAGATTSASNVAQAAVVAVPTSAAATAPAPVPTVDSHTAGRFGSACVTQWHYYSRTVAAGGSAADRSPDARSAAAAPTAAGHGSASSTAAAAATASNASFPFGTATSNVHSRPMAAAACSVSATSATALSSIAAPSRPATDGNGCDWHLPLPQSTRNSKPLGTDLPVRAGLLSSSGADVCMQTATLGARQLAAVRAESPHIGPSSTGDAVRTASATSMLRVGEPVAAGLRLRQGSKAAAAPSFEQSRVMAAFGRIGTALACKGHAVPGTARWVVVAAAAVAGDGSCSSNVQKRCQVVSKPMSLAASACNVGCCDLPPNAVVDEEMNRRRQADMLLVQEKDRRLLADESVRRLVCGALSTVDQRQLAAAEPQPPVSHRQPDSSPVSGQPEVPPSAVTAAMQQSAEMVTAQDQPTANELTNWTLRCNDAGRGAAVARAGHTLPLASSSFLPSTVVRKEHPTQRRPLATSTVHGIVLALPVKQPALTGTEIIVDSGSDDEGDTQLQNDRRPALQAERRSIRRPPLPPIERHLRSSRTAGALDKTVSTGKR